MNDDVGTEAEKKDRIPHKNLSANAFSAALIEQFLGMARTEHSLPIANHLRG